MVTANNPLTGHHQVVHPMKRAGDVQPDDGLLEAETCSCVLTFKRLLYNFMICLTQRGCRTSKGYVLMYTLACCTVRNLQQCKQVSSV